MQCLFYECNNLKTLPNISKWNTNNVTNLNGIFYNCYSLIDLPDISKWDINNVKNIEYAFYCCSSLKYLPNINNWNTILFKDGIFEGCDSCYYFPFTQKLNINDINRPFLLNKAKSNLNSFSSIIEKSQKSEFISNSFSFKFSSSIKSVSIIKLSLDNNSDEYFNSIFEKGPSYGNIYDSFYD